jgi:acyl-CoA thioesterase II
MSESGALEDLGVITKQQAEHQLITTSFELEQLDTYLFRSKSLEIPARARGVFGGQVIAQALTAATKCVDNRYSAHSLNCYFLRSAKASVPILYYVENLYEGRTYTTRSVKAVQNGQVIFIMTSSFQRPELDQPEYAKPLSSKVLPPEQCPAEEDLIREAIVKAEAADKSELREYLKEALADRLRSPIDIRNAGMVADGDMKTHMFWMRARGIPKMDAPFQKCILAYISDHKFIGTVARTYGQGDGGAPRVRIGMMSTLDHSLWFYDHDFDCSQWLLFAMESPRGGMGRGIVHGRFYTQQGKLIAVATQEGVARATQPPPSKL